MLKVLNITKGYGSETILNRISFVINQGERVGLVGPNGIGKSTLLKIIAGEEKPDSGEIEQAKGFSLVYMPQRAPNATTCNAEKARTFFTKLNLHHLNLNNDAAMSGGERSKLSLANVLSTRADCYLLDEPTNNLDFPALRVLEQEILDNTKSSFLIVSHDREFLDRTVEKIFEIDEFSHSIKEYAGNYSQYEREKQKNRENEYKQWDEQQKEFDRLEHSLEEKKKWVGKATKGPKVKDNNKLGRGYAKDRSKVLGGVTKNIETRLKKIEAVQKPRDHWDLHFTVSPLERSGDIVLRAIDVEKQLGDFHLGPLSLELQNGERVAILGLNGVGKTTLLNLLAGVSAPTHGEIKKGTKVTIGFLEQTLTRGGEMILTQFMRMTGLPETDARKLLHKFGLGKDDVKKQFEVLSLGERMRLEVAGFVARGVNFLILDEPTNNLDWEAINELERVLNEFKGTLLVVTHDRRFIKNIKIDKYFALEHGALREFGSLESYENTSSS